MAGYATAKKRQREAAKRERQQEKAARRAQRKQQQHEPRVPGAEGEDPDLVGIVGGPQPTKEENQ
jgi:hypothetical protein